MTCRHFSQPEITTLFNKKILPKDVEDGLVIGVSEVCSIALIIENHKINGVHEDILKQKYLNISDEIKKGRIWILELTSENISRLLLDEDFYEDYCDKRANPLVLSQRISLYYDNDYSFWTENVYLEAFEK